MSDYTLVYDMLDYGRRTLTNASWLTIFTILFFFTVFFMLLKLQWIVLTPGSSGVNKKHTHNTSNSGGSPVKRSDYNRFLKSLPSIMFCILLAVFVYWVIGLNIQYKRTTWQSDYFIGFMVTLFLFILLCFYEMKLKLRRTVSWIIINGMFKLTFVVLTGMIFAPYYILVSSKEESFWDGGYITIGLLLFLSYTVICFYAFRMSPLSTLVPMVVLWGADISYFAVLYAVENGILRNGSSLIVLMFSLFGVSIFKGVGRHQRVASPEFMLAYCVFISIVIGALWFSLWTYYEYPLLGTEYESFHSGSFYS